MTTPREPSVRAIREVAGREPLVLYRNKDWESRFAGVVCGVTAGAAGGDFGHSTARSTGHLRASYAQLCAQLDFGMVALATQVHGRQVRHVRSEPEAADPPSVGVPPTGSASALRLVGEADGLVCDDRGMLLAVSVADCVPVHVLEPESGTILLLHAGWRGIAAGILESGIAAITERSGAGVGRLWVHLGPAICGCCYEVGPDVMQALGKPAERGHIDLRSELTQRAHTAGVNRAQMSVSAWCSRCSADRFHSHRGSHGLAGRMAAFLGWHATDPRSVARRELPG